jgi:hypothetical protein
MIILFHTIVLPTLNYAAAVWGHYAGQNIVVVHKQSFV